METVLPPKNKITSFEKLKVGDLFITPGNPERVRIKRWDGKRDHAYNTQALGDSSGNHSTDFQAGADVIPVKKVTLELE